MTTSLILHDTSRVFLARQPIFRRNMRVFGYELLFRSGLENFCSTALDGVAKTSKVINNSHSLLGMQRVLQGKRGFINFPEQMLDRYVPILFSPRNTVVEILEDVEPTPAVIKACTLLVHNGYILALDDFRYHPKFAPLLELARIVKFDVRDLQGDELVQHIKAVQPFNVKLLAEKVENQQEFEEFRDKGFHLFQGYFFARPQIIEGRDIPGAKLHYLQILQRLQDRSADYDELAELVSHDVSLAYKLLQYVNSAAFATRVEIKSLQSAIALVGEDRLRQWVEIMMLSYMADDKPQELLRLSVQRAKFCALVGEHVAGLTSSSTCYTAGLFSLLEVILQRSIFDILKGLHLEQELYDALVFHRGKLGGVLVLAKVYERGQWRKVEKCCQALGISSQVLPKILAAAIAAANQIYLGE